MQLRKTDFGADECYFAGSLRLVEAMANEGIPVSGHVGCVPRWNIWTGARSVGKTPDEAVETYRYVKSLEIADARFVEKEFAPVEVADFDTPRSAHITMGMCCGSVCDMQILLSCEFLGTNTGRYPRHSKKYADLASEEIYLQSTGVEAFRSFFRVIEDGVSFMIQPFANA